MFTRSGVMWCGTAFPGRVAFRSGRVHAIRFQSAEVVVFSRKSPNQRSASHRFTEEGGEMRGSRHPIRVSDIRISALHSTRGFLIHTAAKVGRFACWQGTIYSYIGCFASITRVSVVRALPYRRSPSTSLSTRHFTYLTYRLGCRAQGIFA